MKREDNLMNLNFALVIVCLICLSIICPSGSSRACWQKCFYFLSWEILAL